MKPTKTRVNRMVRGGYYFDYAERLRVVCRYWDMSKGRGKYVSFRYVLRGRDEAHEE